LPDEARLIGAVLVSLAAVWILTPVALRLAVRTAFFDHPVGYKAHAAPTAYMGGAAVVSGFLIAAVLFGEGLSRFAPVLACALGLSIVGTLDDRFAIRPRYRILAEVAAATILWDTGLGWSFPSSPFVELVLTTVWVVGFANAFNLMDNMDGAASTVAAVCAAGVAGQAFLGDDTGLAALSLALAGACVGFLRFNLRRGAPARIFLGDGGSVPIGFIVAAAAMNVPVDGRLGWPVLLVGAMLLGLPVLDTLLVVVSRTRRGISLATGGRDHLTHRLHMRLASVRVVAAALAVTQAGVSALAIASAEGGRTTTIVTSLGLLALGAAIVAVLEQPAWAMTRGPPVERAARGSEPAPIREP
jgi:UDP-GlcNAc:undecaprenyl-phosphate/decaprenyl-phosphate GlcNAc-1-phosphate transferase